MAQVWHAVRAAAGLPEAGDFELRDVPDAPLGEGMVRVRNRWLSIDPFLRRLMNGPMEMHGPAVGEVVESRAAGIAPGALVRHALGWRDETVVAAAQVQPITDTSLPTQAWLGPLAGSGMTAYFGLLVVAEAKPGDRVFVSSGAGAVGSMVVQIARHRGMFVVASAGGAEKCAWLKELGADAVVDYRAPGSLVDKLRAAAPEGIDVYFDNVGGEHLDAAIAVCRMGARIALAGSTSTYNDVEPRQVINQPMQLVGKALTLRGFRMDNATGLAELEQDMAAMVKSGAITDAQTVYEGLNQAPHAFIGLFTGLSRGKPLVRL